MKVRSRGEKMKLERYKLKRDLPTFKAGEIFYLSDMGNLIRESDNIPAYSWSTIDKFPNILTDWFEEVNESTRWKPEMHQVYRYINSDGYIYGIPWTDDYFDNGRFEIGNCFQTKEEAEQVIEYLKALAVVRGGATSKFTKDESNYYVFYSFETNSLRLGCSWNCIKNGTFGLPYFATEEDAKRSIELHKNEWLTIFGIEEEESD